MNILIDCEEICIFHNHNMKLLIRATVVKLLQYSGLGSNTGMGFLLTNDLSEVKNGELNLDFKAW